MFCKNCGHKIDGDEKFCSSCGHSLSKEAQDTKSQRINNNEQPTEKKFSDILWSKLLEIVKAEGKEKKKYDELISASASEIITRLSVNSFNGLMEEFKIDLDRQPYKAIEAIKNNLLIFDLNSYQVYLAEKLLGDKTIKKVEIKDPEILAEEWQKVNLNWRNKITVIPEDVALVLNTINAQLCENPFNDNPTLKDLPKAVVDAIKDRFIQQLINGYLLGIAENNIREK